MWAHTHPTSAFPEKLLLVDYQAGVKPGLWTMDWTMDSKLAQIVVFMPSTVTTDLD